MSLAAESAISLYGAFRLARFDPHGMRCFNIAPRGFWRSFSAAVIVAPFYAMLLATAYPALEGTRGPVRFALAEGIAYVVAWVAYPLVMAWLTQQLDRFDRFIGYIVAYNWAAVLQNAVIIPINMLWITGTLQPDFGFLLWVIAFSLILAYLWFIARTALALAPMAAASIVGIDVVLNLMISTIAHGMR
jgi:hypothetical protein